MVSRKTKLAFLVVALVGAVLLTWVLLRGNTLAVLQPKGPIAEKQRILLITALLLTMIVVIPVFVMTFTIAWKYRASNRQARYSPEWDHSRLAETVWWGVPLLIITALSVLIWKSSHELDPTRQLSSNKKPVTIQVVAMDWKWLFIYPEQRIATVNFIQFPEDTPVNFEITSDAPMNSFWIPQLGGQIYAMAGMSTKLHLLADEPGDYRGVSANISGKGFAGMKFIARASSDADFTAWVESVRRLPDSLSQQEYNVLAKPSENNPVAYYSYADSSLYDNALLKYNSPTYQSSNHTNDTSPMYRQGDH